MCTVMSVSAETLLSVCISLLLCCVRDISHHQRLIVKCVSIRQPGNETTINHLTPETPTKPFKGLLIDHSKEEVYGGAT